MTSSGLLKPLEGCVGISSVRNEEDIIEAFVRHNLCVLERLFILDHKSTDRTAEILLRLQQEGLPITLIRDHSIGNDHGGRTTRILLRAVGEPGVKWVFPLDADEFIRAGSTMATDLAAAEGQALKVAMQTYSPVVQDDPQEPNPLLRLQHRLKTEPGSELSPEKRPRTFYKTVLSSSLVQSCPGVLGKGNHYYESLGCEVAWTYLQSCVYGHFSIRSAGQYANKIALWTCANLANPTLTGNPDDFYYEKFEQLKMSFHSFRSEINGSVPRWLPGELKREKEKQVHEMEKDPFPYLGGKTIYTTTSNEEDALISNLVHLSETLARSLGEALASSGEREETQAGYRLWVSSSDGDSNNGLRTPHELLASPTLHTLRISVPEEVPMKKLSLWIDGPPAVVTIHEMTLLTDKESIPCRPVEQSTLKLIEKGGLDVSGKIYRDIIKSAYPLVLSLGAKKLPEKSVKFLQLKISIQSNHGLIARKLLTPPIIEWYHGARRNRTTLERTLHTRSTFKGALFHQLSRLFPKRG